MVPSGKMISAASPLSGVPFAVNGHPVTIGVPDEWAEWICRVDFIIMFGKFNV